ncbi:MAG: tRNA lysidine(34) synthetase TilS [Snodgrassella sp.]|uniref:tRNA lysidine(34) synthetase TilS n=1 Tax=Snodgrassella TaxID=1193515 RepID=UPI0008162B2C|nr:MULTISPECIES: tRNA lysidine(34) synthetase TilS [Snodgrassella]MCO6515708.1 tRNA lysidine(34) synthetase TilS [Snodgrassella sp.]SCB97419.1 tRNA(Ile)-lysidine synthase [Snodgrassella sp. R-53583]
MVSSAVNKFCIQLCDSIAQQWSATMAGRCILSVGLSGGLDSVVLLHALTLLRHRLPLEVSAIHVHHGLSRHADEWAAFCQQLCASWSVPLKIVKVDVCAVGEGLEAAARKVRYQVYADSEADAVVLAHHRDDQIETFFLGALRGGGLRSLSAMPAVRKLTERTALWRPLLHFSRQQLQAYADEMQLVHIEDDSNSNCAYLRNWLRLDGLPHWREHLPNLDTQIEAAVGRLQDELALLDEVVEADWAMIHAQQQGFQIPLWRTLSGVRRRQQLRLFAHKNCLGMSTAAALIEFERQLMESKNGAQWSLPQACIIYYDSRLWIDRHEVNGQWRWFGQLPVACRQLVAAHYLQWNRHSFGLAEIIAEWTVRQVHVQDTIVLRGGRKKVKKLLQERKIPPFMRAVWPVLCDSNNQCVAVINVAVATDIGVVNGWMPFMEDLPIRL